MYSRDNDSYNEGVKAKEPAGSNRKPVNENRSDTNNNFSNLPKQQHDNRAPFSVSQTSSTQKSPNDDDHMWSYRQSGHNRLTKQSQSGEDAKFGNFSNSSSSSAVDSGRAVRQDSRNEGLISRESSSLHAVNEAKSRNETFKTREASTSDKLQSERDVMAVKSSRNIGSRTQSKIGSILKTFEDSTAKSNLPKEGYNERINLHERRSAFENVSENDYRYDSSFSHSEDVVSGDSGDDSLQEAKFNSHQTQMPSVLTTTLITSTSTQQTSLPAVTPSVSSAQNYSSTTNTQQVMVS